MANLGEVDMSSAYGDWRLERLIEDECPYCGAYGNADFLEEAGNHESDCPYVEDEDEDNL